MAACQRCLPCQRPTKCYQDSPSAAESVRDVHHATPTHECPTRDRPLRALNSIARGGRGVLCGCDGGWVRPSGPTSVSRWRHSHWRGKGCGQCTCLHHRSPSVSGRKGRPRALTSVVEPCSLSHASPPGAWGAGTGSSARREGQKRCQHFFPCSADSGRRTMSRNLFRLAADLVAAPAGLLFCER